MLSLLSKVIVAIGIVLITPFFANAAACDCFCGTSTVGALRQSNTYASASACREACEDADKVFVGCYESRTDWPREDVVCWTREECEDWYGERGGETIGATWAGQNAVCEPGMGYCYADAANLQLNVSIGSLTETSGIAEYVAVVYEYSIPVAALIAVIMLMIGGLQYALARGKEKYIGAAKTRMTNAITGLVLLLSAYVILNLIDPRLTSFDELRMPMQKKVVLLDRNSSCEALELYGYVITAHGDGSRTCMDTGTIISADNVTANVSSSLKKGDECIFSTCTEAGTTCTTTGCKSCVEITNATESLCESLEAEDEPEDYGTKYDCFYVPDVEGGVCWELVGGGEEHGINCNRLQINAASAAYQGCFQYNTALSINGETELGEGYLGNAAWIDAFTSACELDICNLYQYNTDAVGCYVTTSSAGELLCAPVLESLNE